MKLFIHAGASGKRCTAYFSPSLPCVVNVKRFHLDVFVGCLRKGPAINQNVTYLAVDFALCAPVHQVYIHNTLSNMKCSTLRVLQYRSGI